VTKITSKHQTLDLKSGKPLKKSNVKAEWALGENMDINLLHIQCLPAVARRFP
jgi:hypothetical protein